MIVDPDFLDHWRTGMVADAIGDAMAAIYILRLWAHCQERKSDTFVMPARGLKAQCKCPVDAQTFETALIDAGFIERIGDTVHVLGWAEKNAALLAAWENGAKGGRPKKNPDETHGLPNQNPAVTQTEPRPNPDETDKSREDKKNSPSLRSGETRARRAPESVPIDALTEAGMDAQTAADFVAHKARLKAPLTARAWADHCREAKAAGWSVQQAAEKVMARAWKGFEAKYVQGQAPPSRTPMESFRERDRKDSEAKIAFLTGRKPNREIVEMEATDVTAKSLGGTHLSEAVRDVRPSLPSPVRRG